ncbi:MAG: cupin domain-containing protein [Anaerolineae bacterium]|nr:cupin domain-containing protein [Anaerolineae bacterium]
MMPGKHYSMRAADCTAYFVIGDIIHVRVTGADTNGAYSAVEVVSLPGGGPSFLHTHEPQETFIVMEGSFELYGQDENGEKYAIRAEVGDTVQVPANMPHGFKNVGDGIGRMLLIYEPADPMLRFFAEVGLPVAPSTSAKDVQDSRSGDEILAILRKYMTLVEMPG